MAVKQNLESQAHHNHNQDVQQMSQHGEAPPKYKTGI